VKALDHLERGGETIALNVGTGTGTSVRAVLEAIERVSGRAVPHDIVGRRAGDPVALYSDNSLVRTTLGWEPSRGLDEIIGSAWNWHSALAAR
jgi:UDP-glucose 4-epimerase